MKGKRMEFENKIQSRVNAIPSLLNPQKEYKGQLPTHVQELRLFTKVLK